MAVLDPRDCNIGHDANALDRDGTERDALVDRFRLHAVAGTLTIVIPGGVRQEVLHPHTPADVWEAVLPRVFNLRPEPATPQRQARRRVAAVLRGNAQPSAHAADASHLSEAAETGCGYFITHDKRILRKRAKLRPVLPPTLSIVTLAEFFDVLDRFEAERPG